MAWARAADLASGECLGTIATGTGAAAVSFVVVPTLAGPLRGLWLWLVVASRNNENDKP